jgi:hypothetical protein
LMTVTIRKAFRSAKIWLNERNRPSTVTDSPTPPSVTVRRIYHKDLCSTYLQSTLFHGR